MILTDRVPRPEVLRLRQPLLPWYVKHQVAGAEVSVQWAHKAGENMVLDQEARVVGVVPSYGIGLLACPALGSSHRLVRDTFSGYIGGTITCTVKPESRPHQASASGYQ